MCLQVDRAVDAVGYQAVDKEGSKEQPNIVLDQLIMVTRACGGLGIPGLYVSKCQGVHSVVTELAMSRNEVEGDAAGSVTVVWLRSQRRSDILTR